MIKGIPFISITFLRQVMSRYACIMDSGWNLVFEQLGSHPIGKYDPHRYGPAGRYLGFKVIAPPWICSEESVW